MFTSKLAHNAPSSGRGLYWLGRFWYWLSGWEVVGELPKDEKFVLIGAHHTSNWDFSYTLCACFIARLKTSWMAKHSLFYGPLGAIMRTLGGLSINRSKAGSVVDQMVEKFQQNRKLVVLLSTEGTRSEASYWKSGFYRVAYKAKVPVVCAYLDYQHKQACFGMRIMLTGDVKHDMDKIRAFYSDVSPKRPELITPVRLKDERKICD